MTRLYYTCPIKALYMAKEFGVKTYMEAKIISSCNLTTGEITKGGVDIFSFEEYFDDILGNDLEALNNNDIKIYVATESEHIFKPINNDLAQFTRDDGISTIAQYDQVKKAFINGNFRILKKYNLKIIMRDNKQFFMPEVEND